MSLSFEPLNDRDDVDDKFIIDDYLFGSWFLVVKLSLLCLWSPCVEKTIYFKLIKSSNFISIIIIIIYDFFNGDMLICTSYMLKI